MHRHCLDASVLNQHDNDSIDESSYANNDQSSKEKRRIAIVL